MPRPEFTISLLTKVSPIAEELENTEEVSCEYVNGGNSISLPPDTLILKAEYVFVTASKVKVPVALPPPTKETDISAQVNGTADAELAKIVAAVLTTKAATAVAFQGLFLRDERAMIFLRRLWKIP